MPIVNGKMLTPDEAIAQNRCPECGVDLTKVNPIAHSKAHWRVPPRDDRYGREGLRRQKLLQDFIAKHNIGTTNHPAKPVGTAIPPA
jgi:hypothetical protein